MFGSTTKDVLLSPSTTDSKLRDRSSMYKRRHESPKFRDLLRERCRSRIKASRRSLIDEFRRRADSDGIRDVLTTMLHEEVEVLRGGAPDFPNEVDENLSYAEDEEQWLLAEYEKILKEEESALFSQWENEVICPICEKSVLIETIDDSIACQKCFQRFPTGTNLHELRQLLDRSISSHDDVCADKCQFALIPDNESTGFYQLCDACGLIINLL